MLVQENIRFNFTNLCAPVKIYFHFDIRFALEARRKLAGGEAFRATTGILLILHPSPERAAE